MTDPDPNADTQDTGSSPAVDPTSTPSPDTPPETPVTEPAPAETEPDPLDSGETTEVDATGDPPADSSTAAAATASSPDAPSATDTPVEEPPTAEVVPVPEPPVPTKLEEPPADFVDEQNAADDALSGTPVAAVVDAPAAEPNPIDAPEPVEIREAPVLTLKADVVEISKPRRTKSEAVREEFWICLDPKSGRAGRTCPAFIVNALPPEGSLLACPTCHTINVMRQADVGR